jgi:hypothetical protein
VAQVPTPEGIQRGSENLKSSLMILQKIDLGAVVPILSAKS